MVDRSWRRRQQGAHAVGRAHQARTHRIRRRARLASSMASTFACSFSGHPRMDICLGGLSSRQTYSGFLNFFRSSMRRAQIVSGLARPAVSRLLNLRNERKNVRRDGRSKLSRAIAGAMSEEPAISQRAIRPNTDREGCSSRDIPIERDLPILLDHDVRLWDITRKDPQELGCMSERAQIHSSVMRTSHPLPLSKWFRWKIDRGRVRCRCSMPGTRRL